LDAGLGLDPILVERFLLYDALDRWRSENYDDAPGGMNVSEGDEDFDE
jgi:hypothetical protein